MQTKRQFSTLINRGLKYETLVISLKDGKIS
jgi:hypothetical protein